MKKFFEKRYNQRTTDLPKYVLLLMASYVTWQMGIIWMDANNSVIDAAGKLSNTFMTTLPILCVIVSLITLTSITIKPKIAYKTCIVATLVSLITTVILLTNNCTETCLAILVASCSVMSISSLVIYFFTYSSTNIKRQIVIEMIGVTIVNLLFHTSLIKMSFLVYNLVSFILLLLFIIGLFKIMDLDIILKKPVKKESNFNLYLGITVIILVFHVVATVGVNVISQLKYGSELFYSGGLVGVSLYIILQKSKIKKAYIPTIFIAIFLLSLAFLRSTPLVASFLLGITNIMLFALPYYCNLVYKNTKAKAIYLIFNLVGILQVFLMDIIINATKNNLDLLLFVYLVISIVSLCIMFIVNNSINQKIDEMIKLEKKDKLFTKLTNSGTKSC